MLLDDLTLEVRDRTLTRVGQVTAKHMSFRGKKRWCGVGEWTLTLPGDHAMVPHLMEKGSGIILTGPVGKVFHPRTWSPWVESDRNTWTDPLAEAKTTVAQDTGSGAGDLVTTFPGDVKTAYQWVTTVSSGASRMFDFIQGVDSPATGGWWLSFDIDASAPVTIELAYRSSIGVTISGQTLNFDVPAGTSRQQLYIPASWAVTPGSTTGLTMIKRATWAIGTTLKITKVKIGATPDWFTPSASDTLTRSRWLGATSASVSVREGRTVTAEPSTDTVLGPIMSGPTWKPQRVRNRQNPDGTFTFTGHTDEIHLIGALAFPSPEVADPAAQTRANDTRTGSTEDLMRAYVAYNIANGAVRPAGAVSWAPAGRLRGMRSKLVLDGESASRGLEQQKSPRFQPLHELLTELVAGDPDYGFEVVQVGDLLHFRVLEASDRTGTIRLDVENGTITSEEVQTQGPTLTDAIVAGQGEGTARTIIQRTTPEAEAAEEEYGLVWERFIDQRQTNDLVELQQSGDEELEKGRGGTSVKMLPSDDSTMQYGRDWVVGDLLTTVVLGTETVARSTEAVFIADSSGVMVGTAIGDVSGFTAQDAEGSKVESLDERVARLERMEASASSRNPSGVVVEYAGATAPEGWLLCQGQSLLRADYPTLFAAIGTTYGSVDGTHFTLPNAKGRAVVGLDAAQTEFNALGKTGGAKTHTLTFAEVPDEDGLRITWGQGNIGFSTQPQAYAGAPTGNGLGTWQNDPKWDAGGRPAGGGSHNNLQPFIVMNYIIKT